jgi:RNA polymerase sigma-70 factor, ECF subfamily
MLPVDTDAVCKACQGDRNAFSCLMQERRDDIYKLAFSYVKNSEDALDILHNVVYKAFISINKVKNPEYFNTWIFRITINACIDHLKKCKRQSRFESSDESERDLELLPDANENSPDLISSIDLFQALEKLSVEQRSVVILKYYQDFTLAQIAELLSWPLGTVKTRLNKALAVLRQELKESYNESA